MLYVGIDIAKRSHEVGILDESGGHIGPSFKVANTEAGFSKLLDSLKKAGATAAGCIVGMEATGHYWLAMYSHLMENGYTVFVVNPIQTDAFRNVGTVRAAKTDAIDAFLIADLMRFGRFSVTHMADESIIALRQLTRHRRSLIKQRTALKNRLTAVLDMVFPEYAGLFSDMYGASSMAVLGKCPIPADMLRYGKARMVRLLSKHSNGKLGARKADELLSAAKESFGITYGTDAISFQVEQTVALIAFVSEQVERLDRQIAICLEGTGTYIDTIPGIGPVFASIIVAEIGDVSRFDGPSQIIAYAGMDVPANQSGEFMGTKKHMSKRGPAQLRWALIEGADRVRAYDPYFMDYYDRLISRGKHHYVALAAVARKLVNVIFVLLREQRPYQAKPPEHSHHKPA